ncbi:hypothetical protein VNO77_24662 [Canavalia gladiata]|uniref:Uncharacterized protein n=1 Tax=Canavalia gladiata TaxID=3824 RepID=A0AAN9QCU8_CANGL
MQSKLSFHFLLELDSFVFFIIFITDIFLGNNSVRTGNICNMMKLVLLDNTSYTLLTHISSHLELQVSRSFGMSLNGENYADADLS